MGFIVCPMPVVVVFGAWVGVVAVAVLVGVLGMIVALGVSRLLSTDESIGCVVDGVAVADAHPASRMVSAIQDINCFKSFLLV